MRTLVEMSCGSLEKTRLSVQLQLGTIQREDIGLVVACVDIKSFFW
jgi:hypothetical protein